MSSVLNHQLFGSVSDQAVTPPGGYWFTEVSRPNATYYGFGIAQNKNIIAFTKSVGVTTSVVVMDVNSGNIISEFDLTIPDTGAIYSRLRPYDVAIDDERNIYVSCATDGWTTTGVLAKFDISGNLLFSTTTSGYGLNKITLDHNGDIICSVLSTRTFLKFDRNSGNPIASSDILIPLGGQASFKAIAIGKTNNSMFYAGREELLTGGVKTYRLHIEQRNLGTGQSIFSGSGAWNKSYERQVNGVIAEFTGHINKLIHDNVNDVLYAFGYVAVNELQNRQGMIMKIDATNGNLLASKIVGSPNTNYTREFSDGVIGTDGSLYMSGFDHVAGTGIYAGVQVVNNTSIFKIDTTTLDPIWEYATLPTTRITDYAHLVLTDYNEPILMTWAVPTSNDVLIKIDPNASITNGGTINLARINPPSSGTTTFASYGMVLNSQASSTGGNFVPNPDPNLTVTASIQSTPLTTRVSPFALV